MTELTPPISLDGLPRTHAVWQSLFAFQEPFRAVSKLARLTKVKSRLEYMIWPATPTAGNAVFQAVDKKLSMHQRLAHHEALNSFDQTRLTLAMCLQDHPAHFTSEHVFCLRAHAKAEILTGNHNLPSGNIQWNAGRDPAILTHFLSRLAQYERLAQITPAGELKQYAFVTRRGSSTRYHYCKGVDAADAALKTLAGSKTHLFQGAGFHDKTPGHILPEPGDFPDGEEDWMSSLKMRAGKAGIALRDE